ncbi:MAG: ABC transporter ATP-binding protein [Devosia sp.]
MIEIEGLTRIYGTTPVVDNVSFTVPRGEICVVVGTSGSGKTTLLRMINRLVEPSSGTVRIDAVDTRSVVAYQLRRRIGYVIQGNGLFPHRTVGQNIATVPSLLNWDKDRIRARVDELLSLFQLDPDEYRNRMPRQLSGGQQQRIGVARALAAEPEILLMDEPFGALDPVIRSKAQADLLAIQRRFGTTIMLVTHDMTEAMALGTRIAVMDAGQLLQYAPPAEIISRPATGFVDDLIGSGDRPFRMLALQKVRDHVEPGAATGLPIDGGASLREAYAECLWSGRDALPVDLDGRRVGRITLAHLTALAARPE